MNCISEWPESQRCMDCSHGEFLINRPNSSYCCELGHEVDSEECRKDFIERPECDCDDSCECVCKGE